MAIEDYLAKEFTMVPVTSSHLKSVGWLEGEMRIQFKDGSTYSYPSVPIEVYENLLIAESAGKFFNQNVKGTYSGSKL